MQRRSVGKTPSAEEAPPLDNNLIRWWKIHPPHPFPIIPGPVTTQSLTPARPHSPFTLCALISLPMRVIGISKRWRGQKGTQPHPENLIGESLEAQHSKGESLLNYTVYAYIPTYASFILRSVKRLFFITQGAVETSAIQTSLPPPTHLLLIMNFDISLPPPFPHFIQPNFGLMFLPFHR